MKLTAEATASFSSALTTAALDPARWPEVVATLQRIEPGSVPFIYAFDGSAEPGGRNLASATGYDGPLQPAFQAHYAEVNPYAAAAATVRPGEILTNDQMVPRRVLERTEFYNDFLRPNDDLRTGVGFVGERRHSSLMAFGMQFPSSLGERLEEDWKANLAILRPILMGAWQVARRLAANQFEAELKEGRARGTAILVLDHRRRISFANRAAEAMLARGAPIAADIGGRLVADWLAPLGPAAGMRPRLLRHQGIEAQILRLDPALIDDWRAGLLLGLTDPATLILLHHLPAPDDLRADLRRRYGLTAAEAEIAIAMHDGQTPAEIAEARRVSLHTVRNQIKTILGKCEVRRQVELVALIGRLMP